MKILPKAKDIIKSWTFKGFRNQKIYLYLVKPGSIGDYYGTAGIISKHVYIINLEKRSEKIIEDTLIHELTHVCWYMFQKYNPKLRISTETLALFNEAYFWKILHLYKGFMKRIRKVL